VKKRIYVGSRAELLNMAGEQDRNLRLLERVNRVEITYNPIAGDEGFEVDVVGGRDNVEKALAELHHLLNTKKPRQAAGDPEAGREHSRRSPVLGRGEYLALDGDVIRPKTENQRLYLEAMDRHDLVVAVGPAGTGKTFLAVMKALILLEQGEIFKIVLTRPVVEAGERLGFLPGDLYDKVNPYLKPLYDAFFVMLGPDRLRRYLDQETVEIVPLAYMRGRTLNDAFIILDEAQNTTTEQMKMFLTRMGFNSKVVVTGDVTQIDLDNKRTSGLLAVGEVLRGIDEIYFMRFDEHDIVRHALVRKIVKAYESWESRVPRR